MQQERMFNKIIKRNDQLVDFDIEKLTGAIKKAGKATGEFNEIDAKNLSMQVIDLAIQIIFDRHPTVEEIQDLVEEVLLSSTYRKTAKAYIIYREQHSKLRDVASKFNVDLVDKYLTRSGWFVKENSNMSYSLQGLNYFISSEISKVYWNNKIYTPEVKEAHLNGDLHIHDLGCLGVYCVGWNLYDLLMLGFKGVSGKMEALPAKHFRSALGQVVNFFYTLQGEAAGAQAFSNFDTLLAPFISYDNLNYKEVKQALQEFLFNVNVPTRVGFQSPFTNVTLDLTVPSYLAGEGVIVGGKIKTETYQEFQKEMDIFNQAFMECMLEGDAKGRVFTFPIPTYSITDNFDWDNPNMDLLWQITAKYGIPYFANFINSDMTPEDSRSMCCRLRIDNRVLKSRGGGLFGASPLTGSIGVVTINMPRLGYLASSEKQFLVLLAHKMRIAFKSLEIKRKVLENFTEQNLYPYTKFYLRDVKKRFGEYWKNHFSTIGLIGMNEACENLFEENIGSKRGQQFTLKVLDFMSVRLLEFQEESGNNFNLESTPAEGASYRLARIDRDTFPSIKSANVDEPFYTNSTNLPVDYSADVFEVLDIQDQFQTQYTGGTVLHIFIGEKIDNIQGLKTLVKTICMKYRLPYFTITPTFSVCPICGYIAGEIPICQKCGKTCEIYSRVVGYLRPVAQWNRGKRQEFKDRKTYKINLED